MIDEFKLDRGWEAKAEGYMKSEIAKAIGGALKPGMSPEQAARAALAAIRPLVDLYCYEGAADYPEAFVKGPADDHYAGDCWLLCWESGPFEWGVSASLSGHIHRFCEPYYSFDLCFYAEE